MTAWGILCERDTRWNDRQLCGGEHRWLRDHRIFLFLLRILFTHLRVFSFRAFPYRGCCCLFFCCCCCCCWHADFITPPPPRSTSIPSTLHFPSPTPTAQIIQPVATIGYNRGQKQQTRPNQQRPLKRPHKKANCQSEPKRTTTTTRSCRTGHK